MHGEKFCARVAPTPVSILRKVSLISTPVMSWLLQEGPRLGRKFRVNGLLQRPNVLLPDMKLQMGLQVPSGPVQQFLLKTAALSPTPRTRLQHPLLGPLNR